MRRGVGGQVQTTLVGYDGKAERAPCAIDQQTAPFLNQSFKQLKAAFHAAAVAVVRRADGREREQSAERDEARIRGRRARRSKAELLLRGWWKSRKLS